MHTVTVITDLSFHSENSRVADSKIRFLHCIYIGHCPFHAAYIVYKVSEILGYAHIKERTRDKDQQN
jgi:hypothetical protein